MNQNEIRLYILREEGLTDVTFMYKTYSVDLSQLCKLSDFIMSNYSRDETHFSIYFPTNLREIQKSLNINIVSVQAFMRILSGEIELITDEVCYDLYKLSRIYKIKKLNDFILRYCRFRDRPIDDVAAFYLKLVQANKQSEQEDKFLDEFLKKINIIQKLADNVKECLNSEYFKRLPQDQIFLILGKCKDVPCDDLLDFIAESKNQRLIFFSFIDPRKLSEEKKDDLCNNILNLHFILSQYCQLLTSNEEFLQGFKTSDDLYYSKYNRLKQSSDRGNVCSSYFLSTLTKDRKEANEYIDKVNKQSCLAEFFQRYNDYVESLQPHEDSYMEEDEYEQSEEQNDSRRKGKNDSREYDQYDDEINNNNNESRSNKIRSREAPVQKTKNKNNSPRKKVNRSEEIEQNDSRLNNTNRSKQSPATKRKNKANAPVRKSNQPQNNQSNRSKEVSPTKRRAVNNNNNSQKTISDQNEEENEQNQNIRTRESPSPKRRSKSCVPNKKVNQKSNQNVDDDENHYPRESPAKRKTRNLSPTRRREQVDDYDQDSIDNDDNRYPRESPVQKRRNRPNSSKTIPDQVDENNNKTNVNKRRQNENNNRLKESPTSSRRRSQSSSPTKRSIQMDPEYSQDGNDEENDHRSKESPSIRKRNRNQSPNRRSEPVDDYNRNENDDRVNEKRYQKESPSQRKRSSSAARNRSSNRKYEQEEDYNRNSRLNQNQYSKTSSSPHKRNRNNSPNQRSSQMDDY